MKKALVTMLLVSLFASCDNGPLGLHKRPDIVFRCETTVLDTPDGRVVKYRPFEVIDGELGREMLDDDGFLNYTQSVGEDDDVGGIYIFKLTNVSENHYPFGPNCTMSVEIEMANGKGITE